MAIPPDPSGTTKPTVMDPQTGSLKAATSESFPFNVVAWNEVGVAQPGSPPLHLGDPGSGGGGGSTPLANNLTTTTPGSALDARQGPVITGLIGAKFNQPAGTTAQYVRGDGSLATFPSFGSGTVTSVNLTPPAAGITVSGGPVTSSGSIALALADDLAALEALSGTGIARRTGGSAWSVGAAVALASEVSGILPVANGGTGTASPGLVAGSNVTITGAWPNQTINSTGGGGGGSGTVTSVGWAQPAAGITISGTNPITGSGTMTFALADDLAAVEGITATGVVKRTAANTWTAGAVSLTADVSGTLPVANGGTGFTAFGTGVATWLQAPSSANLAAAVTDETGSGALVFANSPTLVTPNLGTPSAAVLTNATGLPVAGGGTGAASLTAYAPVFGGTTSTGPVQSGTVGSAGQVLTSNGAGAIATMQDVNSPAVVTVSASRDFAAGDILSELTNSTGSYTLTIQTGLSTFGRVILLHPTGSGSLTVSAGSGVTLYDGTLPPPTPPATIASFTVLAYQLAIIHCDSSTVWSRVA